MRLSLLTVNITTLTVYFRELGYKQDGCKNAALVPLLFSRHVQPCTELGSTLLNGAFF